MYKSLKEELKALRFSLYMAKEDDEVKRLKQEINIVKNKIIKEMRNDYEHKRKWKIKYNES